MKTKYYSPRLDRGRISPLYHAAKAEGIPMTKLASRWIGEKLAASSRHQAKPARPDKA